jgi:hypothetical protein
MSKSFSAFTSSDPTARLPTDVLLVIDHFTLKICSGRSLDDFGELEKWEWASIVGIGEAWRVVDDGELNLLTVDVLAGRFEFEVEESAELVKEALDEARHAWAQSATIPCYIFDDPGYLCGDEEEVGLWGDAKCLRIQDISASFRPLAEVPWADIQGFSGTHSTDPTECDSFEFTVAGNRLILETDDHKELASLFKDRLRATRTAGSLRNVHTLKSCSDEHLLVTQPLMVNLKESESGAEQKVNVKPRVSFVGDASQNATEWLGRPVMGVSITSASPENNHFDVVDDERNSTDERGGGREGGGGHTQMRTKHDHQNLTNYLHATALRQPEPTPQTDNKETITGLGQVDESRITTSSPDGQGKPKTKIRGGRFRGGGGGCVEGRVCGGLTRHVGNAHRIYESSARQQIGQRGKRRKSSRRERRKNDRTS